MRAEIRGSSFAAMEEYWRKNDCLPKQKAMASWEGMGDITAHTKYGEDKRAWFEMCVESEYLPALLDKYRAQNYGHKEVHDVDFGGLYNEQVQAQQCKEEMLMMARTTPGEIWLSTPRIAMTLMAAAKHLEGAFSRGGEEFGEAWTYGEALQGEAKAAWKSQGPASSLTERLELARDRSWYWGVRDCFTAVAQRIAVGNNPRPKTYAELWACCLIFDAAEDFIQDELHMNPELEQQFNALPVHTSDEDIDIARVTILGPYATASEPQPCPAAASPSSTLPRRTAEEREARINQMMRGLVEDKSPYALRGPLMEDTDLLRRMCEATVEAEEMGSDDEEADEPKYVHGLPIRPIARWFEPIPTNLFQSPLS